MTEVDFSEQMIERTLEYYSLLPMFSHAIPANCFIIKGRLSIKDVANMTPYPVIGSVYWNKSTSNKYNKWIHVGIKTAGT